MKLTRAEVWVCRPVGCLSCGVGRSPLVRLGFGLVMLGFGLGEGVDVGVERSMFLIGVAGDVFFGVSLDSDLGCVLIGEGGSLQVGCSSAPE